MSSLRNPAATPMEGTSQRLLASLRILARVFAEVAALIGAAVLVGWALDIDPLKSVLPGLVSMKPNNAASLVVLGMSIRLLASERTPPALRTAAKAAAVLVAAVGLATLAQYAAGADFRVDQLLFEKAPGAEDASHPGRMAPSAAVAFVLLGLAALLHDAETGTGIRPAQVLALVAALVPVQAIVSYAYGVEPAFGVATYTHLALHSSLALALLSGALLVSRADRGFMRVFTASGLSGLMGRRLLAAMFLLPPVLGWFFLVLGLRIGSYESILGGSFVVVSAMVVGSAVVWWNALKLGELEAERSRARQVEREQREWLRTTLGSIADGVVAADRDGRVTLVNAVAEALTGVRAADAVGRPLGEVFRAVDEESREPVSVPVQKALAERTVFELPPRTVVVSRAGEVRPVGGAAAPIRGPGDAPLGVVLVFHDVTERRRIEAERAKVLAMEQAARTEAEQASRAKDEFIATVSHELRTPLNAVLGWARLLRSGRLDASAAARAVEAIERSAGTQAQIVDDLLDVARFIRGELRLDVRPVDLASVVEAAADTVRPAAAAKNIALTFALPPGGAPARGDPGRLQQVMWNLLSNAIKFTSSGGRVEVRLERREGAVRVEVADSGVGIPPDFLPHVFERFRQADQSSTRRHGGLGLGLAIVRHLVEAHGGIVSVESPGAGKGATFAVSLPIPAPPSQSPTPSPPPGTEEPAPSAARREAPAPGAPAPSESPP